MKLPLILSIAIGASLYSDLAVARKSSTSRADQIRISYVAPKNPEHESVFRLLKERQALEKIQKFLSPLRLPRPLQLKLE